MRQNTVYELLWRVILQQRSDRLKFRPYSLCQFGSIIRSFSNDCVPLSYTAVSYSSGTNRVTVYLHHVSRFKDKVQRLGVSVRKVKTTHRTFRKSRWTMVSPRSPGEKGPPDTSIGIRCHSRSSRRWRESHAYVNYPGFAPTCLDL